MEHVENSRKRAASNNLKTIEPSLIITYALTVPKTPINMAYLTPESESSNNADLSWTQLITDKPRPTIVRISDDKPKEMNPDEVQLNPSENLQKPRRERRESLMGTFHRHLRMSLKAVSESPGPLTR